MSTSRMVKHLRIDGEKVYAFVWCLHAILFLLLSICRHHFRTVAIRLLVDRARTAMASSISSNVSRPTISSIPIINGHSLPPQLPLRYENVSWILSTELCSHAGRFSECLHLFVYVHILHIDVHVHFNLQR